MLPGYGFASYDAVTDVDQNKNMMTKGMIRMTSMQPSD